MLRFHLLAWFVVTASVAPAANLLSLDSAVRAALEQRLVESVDVEIAQGRLKMLEAMNQRRFEFSPQLGLMALANPISFAANTGASLLWKQNPVSPLAILDARIEVLAAQVEQNRRKFAREAEATRRFHELSETQHMANQACDHARQLEETRLDMEGKLAAAVITRADLLQQEQEVLRQETVCRDAERRVDLASLRLAATLGTTVDGVRVQSEPETAPAKNNLRPVDSLLQVALTYRAQPAGLRETFALLRREIEATREHKGLQFSIRYSRLGQGGVFGGTKGLNAGNWIQPEIGLRIPLGKSSPFEAEKRLLQLKLRRLEQALADCEAEIRAEVAEIRLLHEASVTEMPAARKALVVAQDYRKIVALRRQAGLENGSQQIAAEEAEHQAEVRVVRLQYTARSSFAAMLSLCGLQPQPYKERQQLLTQNDIR